MAMKFLPGIFPTTSEYQFYRCYRNVLNIISGFGDAGSFGSTDDKCPHLLCQFDPHRSGMI